MLNHYPAESGVHRPNRSGNNGVFYISSNSKPNSNSNAVVPMPRFSNGRFYISMNESLRNIYITFFC